jgi:metal transporter CNNM
MEALTWIGILFCLGQSAIFSGLNLAFFSVSRLRLEAEAETGNQAAGTVLRFRRDSNFLLTTILWGNVSINVLLTLLANSVLVGAAAFLFSTFVITIAGEIGPQAYFSRHALRTAAMFGPLLVLYQYLLYPVAKPTAWMLDKWLGKETIELLRERQLKEIITQHIQSELGDVDFIEGRGALNFLEIDDVPIYREGERVDEASIVSLPMRVDLPVVPEVVRDRTDSFINQVDASGKKWVILTDLSGTPRLLLDADGYLRSALLGKESLDPYANCHRPVIVNDDQEPLGRVIAELKKGMEPSGDVAIAKDIVLLWTANHRRIVTGADILGRLLRGIG